MFKLVATALLALGATAADAAEIALPREAPIVKFNSPDGWTIADHHGPSGLFVSPDQSGVIIAMTVDEDKWTASVDHMLKDYKARGFTFDEKLVSEPREGRIGGLESLSLSYGMNGNGKRGYITVSVVNLGTERVLVLMGASMMPEGQKWNGVYKPMFDSVKKVN